MPVQNSTDLVLRLFVAVLIGGLIGWNRQRLGKPAGLRTHMLVSLGAALMILIPLQLAPPSPDAISRTIQGVVTGIGFLGAGEILQRSTLSLKRSRQSTTSEPADEFVEPKIKGLTSAASIWTTAALGLVTGCGLWLTSLVGAILVWFTLTLAGSLESFASKPRNDE